jgi:sigma-B regulation protein RsbU (phosphoserine phosphatase)
MNHLQTTVLPKKERSGTAPGLGLFERQGHSEEKLAFIVDTMQEMSRQIDAQSMVQVYGKRMQEFLPVDRAISLSRRELKLPKYRITRSSTWSDDINPWKEPARLPLFEGGLLSELIYSDKPHIIDDLRVSDDDPAAEYLSGHRSLMAIPLFDQGAALNMRIALRERPGAFRHEHFPEMVWMSNLFGRAAHFLVVEEALRRANNSMDEEMKAVGDIQRSLLPAKLPQIPTMDLATYYHTANRAGGDYYDVLSLPNDEFGLLIADVSGHGTPAAVLMAVAHNLAHTFSGPPHSPAKLLEFLNYHIATRYNVRSEMFVTAFYGIYDPATRTLNYSSAGHNPPRLKRCQDGTLAFLDGVGGLPLGVMANEKYQECRLSLIPGDQLVIYTDGITEARNPEGKLFGVERLDAALEQCTYQADYLLKEVLSAVEHFAAGQPADDDRTMIIARIS